LTGIFALYFAVAGAVTSYLVFFSQEELGTERIWLGVGAPIAFALAAGLWAFSERIAHQFIESLIRNPLFRKLVTSPPVQ
jgi:branched-subunit amino acid ABC-type transport system permease component